MPYIGVTTTWPVTGTAVGCTPDLLGRSSTARKRYFIRQAVEEMNEMFFNRLRFVSWFDGHTYYDFYLTSTYTAVSKTVTADYIDRHPNMYRFIAANGMAPVLDHFHYPLYNWGDLSWVMEGVYNITSNNMINKGDYTIDSPAVIRLSMISNEYGLDWTISEIWDEFCVGMDMTQTETLLRRKYRLANAALQECIKVRWGSCWQHRV